MAKDRYGNEIDADGNIIYPTGTSADVATATRSGPAVNPFVPSSDPNSPSIAGWARSVLSDGPPVAQPTMGQMRDAGFERVEKALDGKSKATEWLPPEPGQDPGVPAETRADDAASARVAGAARGEEAWLRGGASVTGPEVFNRKEGISSWEVGGPGVVDAAFGSGAKKTDESMLALEKARGERSDALSKHYDKTAADAAAGVAAFNQTRAEDTAKLEDRQRKLDEATKFYTDDLANQGKYWANPGNIISAIAYSLLPIFGNDPTVGVKLINQAVEQDMANRREAANTTLGALRSNLHGYEKIAGDRQAGEMLARSEAYRVAGMEAERIGQKFESAESKAKLQVIMNDMAQKRALAYGEFRKHNLVVEARRMDPGLHAARAQGVPGAYAAAGAGPDVNPYDPRVGGAVTGSIGGTPSVANGDGKFSPGVSPKTIAIMKTVGGNAGFRALQKDAQVPGSKVTDDDMWLSGDVELSARAHADSGGSAPGTPAYLKAKGALVKEAEREANEKSAAVEKSAARNTGIRMLQQRLVVIDRMETTQGRDFDKFLNEGGGKGVIPASWVNKYNDIARQWGSDPTTEAAKREESIAAMRTGLREQLADAYNGYVRQNSGGAVSDGERAANEAVIRNGQGLRAVSKWVEGQSIKANDEYQASMGGLSAAAKYLLVRRYGMGFAPLSAPGRPTAEQAPIKPRVTESTGYVSGAADSGGGVAGVNKSQ